MWKRCGWTLIAVAGLLVSPWSASSYAGEKVRVQVIAEDCEKGLSAFVESQMLKMVDAELTRKNPSMKLYLTCYWQQSPPGSTSFYSSWGNADLSVKLEHIENESTVYAEAFTKGAKSRGLAMKKCAEAAVKGMLKDGVLPKKSRK